MRSCVAADGADSFCLGLSHSDTLTVASKIIADIACDWVLVAGDKVILECPETPAAVKARQAITPAAERQRGQRGVVRSPEGRKTYKHGDQAVKYIAHESPEGYVKVPEIYSVDEHPCPSMMLKIHRELKGLISQENVEKFYKQHFLSIHEVCCKGIEDFIVHIVRPLAEWTMPGNRSEMVDSVNVEKGAEELKEALLCDYQLALFNAVLHPEMHSLGADVSRPFKMIYPADTPAREIISTILRKEVPDLNFGVDKEIDLACKNDSEYQDLLQQLQVAGDSEQREHFEDLVQKRRRYLRDQLWQARGQVVADKVWTLYDDLTLLWENARTALLPSSEPAESVVTAIDESVERLILRARAYFETIREILIEGVKEEFEGLDVDLSRYKIKTTPSLKGSEVIGELTLSQIKSKETVTWD